MLRLLFVTILSSSLLSCNPEEKNTLPDIASGKDLGQIQDRDTSKDIAPDTQSADSNYQDLENPDLSHRDQSDMVSDMSDVGADADANMERGLSLFRKKDKQTFAFTEFYYGFNDDDTLHVELMVEGTGNCPTMTDPSPDFLFLFGIDSTNENLNDPVALDFKLFEGKPNHAVDLKVNSFTYNATEEFIEMDIKGEDKPHPDSHFSIEGSFKATYCPSLDEG